MLRVGTLIGLAGCLSYTGGAHPIDSSTVTAEHGWIVATPTPELRQAGSLDCGAASFAMIAEHWHVPMSVAAAIGEIPAPNAKGVLLGDLRTAARAHGLIAFAIAGDRATLDHELRAGRPVIVGLALPFGDHHERSHFEVIVAMQPSEGRFVTIDPGTGYRTRTWAALDAEWQPAGRPALVVLGSGGSHAQ